MANELFPFADHTHDGINSLKVKGSDLDPFAVYSAAPTHAAPEGTIVVYSSGGTYKIYVRLGNGWRAATLT